MKTKMIVIGILTLGYLLMDGEKLTAQEQGDGQWTTFTTSNGLPYNEVGALAFGPDGDLWCVLVHPGGGGVAHFDGDIWEHHTSEDGLGSDAILWSEKTLAVSSDNILWVATFDAGVSRYDGETWTSYTTADGLLSDNVTSVAIAPDGELWCTHMLPDCGVSHFNGESWTVYTPGDMGVASCHLMNITFDQDNTLWASGGDYVLHCNDESWTSLDPHLGTELPNGFYLEVGPDGKIWIGNLGTGVSCYDGNTWTHFSLADMGAKGNGELMPLAIDSENVLWVGVSAENADNQEVLKYDGNSWTEFAPEDGPDLKNVYTITVGPDGTIWFGTDFGLFAYSEKATSRYLSDTNEDKLMVYPNPFTDWILIKGVRNIEARISLYNIMGNILFEERGKGMNEFQINTTNLPKGVYFVQSTTKGRTTAYKVVK